MELQYDEYGAGDPNRLHDHLFARGMAASGLDPTYGAYVDEAPLEVLEQNNAHVAASACTVGCAAPRSATSRRSRRPARCRRAGWSQGLERLGFPERDGRLLRRARGGRRGARAARRAHDLRRPARRRSRTSRRTCSSARSPASTSRTGSPARCWPVGRRCERGGRPSSTPTSCSARAGRCCCAATTRSTTPTASRTRPPDRSVPCAGAGGRRRARGATAPTRCCPTRAAAS